MFFFKPNFLKMIWWLFGLFFCLMLPTFYFTFQALKKSKWKKINRTINLEEEFYLPVNLSKLEKFLMKKIENKEDENLLRKINKCFTLILENNYHKLFKKINLTYLSNFDPNLKTEQNFKKETEFDFLNNLTFLIEKANFHQISIQEVIILLFF